MPRSSNSSGSGKSPKTSSATAKKNIQKRDAGAGTPQRLRDLPDAQDYAVTVAEPGHYVFPKLLHPIAVLADGRVVAFRFCTLSSGETYQEQKKWCAGNRLVVGDLADLGNAIVCDHAQPSVIVHDVSANPSGDRLAILYREVVAVIDLTSGQELWRWDVTASGISSQALSCVGWSADGGLALAQKCLGVHRFSPEGKHLGYCQDLAEETYLDGVFTPDAFVAVCAKDVWSIDVATGKEKWRLNLEKLDGVVPRDSFEVWRGVRKIGLSHDGDVVMAVKAGVVIVDAATGKLLRASPLPPRNDGGFGSVSFATISPDGRSLFIVTSEGWAKAPATGLAEPRVLLYDLESGTYSYLGEKTKGGIVNAATWHASGLDLWHPSEGFCSGDKDYAHFHRLPAPQAAPALSAASAPLPKPAAQKDRLRELVDEFDLQNCSDGWLGSKKFDAALPGLPNARLQELIAYLAKSDNWPGRTAKMIKDVALRLISAGESKSAWVPLAKALDDCWGDEDEILHDKYGNWVLMGVDIVEEVLAPHIDAEGAPVFLTAACAALDANGGIGLNGGVHKDIDLLVASLLPHLTGDDREKLMEEWNAYVHLGDGLAELVRKGVVSRANVLKIDQALAKDAGAEAIIARKATRQVLG